jgi:uncharacterized membrane protein YfhO
MDVEENNFKQTVRNILLIVLFSVFLLVLAFIFFKKMVCIYLILAFIILMGYLVRNNNHIKKDVEKELNKSNREI